MAIALIKLVSFLSTYFKDVCTQNVPRDRFFFKLYHEEGFYQKAPKNESHRAHFQDKVHSRPSVFRGFCYFEMMLAYKKSYVSEI